MDIRRGDTVVLLKSVTGVRTERSTRTHHPDRQHHGKPAGKENAGDQGKVLSVLTDSQRVIVEGVHFVWKHQRKTQSAPKGAIIQKEAPIHVSNVQLVCPACGKPTRVAHRREGDRNVRVCKKCKAVIQAGKA